MYVSLKASFLEDLNYIVNGGKIANMFENEELDSIIMRIRTFADQSDFIDDRKYLLSVFQKVLFCVLTLSNCYGKVKADHSDNSVHDFPLVHNFFSSSNES